MTQPSENCNNPDCQRIDMTMRQASEWSRKQDEGGARFERERIIALLDQKHTAHNSDKTHNESGECTACEAIALIKGDNKTNRWTSRPLTEEDKEHYGLEGENE